MKLLLLITIVIMFQSAWTKSNYRFEKVQCKYSAKKTCSNSYCFIKSYSRYNTTLNVGCDFKKGLSQIYAEISSSYRKVGNYRLIFKHKIEICSILKYSLHLPYIQTVIKYHEHALEGPVHQCPYKSIRVHNLTNNHIDFSSWPSGDYKNVLLLSNENDSKIIEVSLSATYRSDDKSDF